MLCENVAADEARVSHVLSHVWWKKKRSPVFINAVRERGSIPARFIPKA